VAGAAATGLCITTVAVMNGRGVGILNVAYEAVPGYDEGDNPADNLLLVAVQAPVIGVDAVIAYIIINNRGAYRTVRLAAYFTASEIGAVTGIAYLARGAV
jgi:hypothetical protein